MEDDLAHPERLHFLGVPNAFPEETPKQVAYRGLGKGKGIGRLSECRGGLRGHAQTLGIIARLNYCRRVFFQVFTPALEFLGVQVAIAEKAVQSLTGNGRPERIQPGR
jgi:hypothetical protein